MPRSAFGVELRRWRELRRLSQLELSLEAGVSQRHLSFLESGKSSPTREMVVRLATALDVPLFDRNALLNAAGYAPSYLQRDLEEPAMDQIRHVLELLLAAHEPFPAHVVDRHWNLLLANQAMVRLIRSLPQSVTDEAGAGGNIVRLTMHRQGLRSVIANWEESAAALLRRLAQDVAYRPGDEELRTLLVEAVEASGVERPLGPARAPLPNDLLIPLHIRTADLDLRLFTSITTIGSPYDITLEGLRLETLLPADSTSEAALHRLAEEESDRRSVPSPGAPSS